MADPATFLLLQTVFWGPCFPLRAACLFSYGNNFCIHLYYHIINTVNVKVQSLNFFPQHYTAPLQSIYKELSVFAEKKKKHFFFPVSGWQRDRRMDDHELMCLYVILHVRNVIMEPLESVLLDERGFLRVSETRKLRMFGVSAVLVVY